MEFWHRAVWDLPAEPRRAPDCLQRPRCSRFRQQVTPGVGRRTKLSNERTYGSSDGRGRSFARGMAHSMNDLDVSGDALAWQPATMEDGNEHATCGGAEAHV
jgi:hypothetical protein